MCFVQLKQLSEPIKVRITEWNTGGLLTRIEVGIGFYCASAALMPERSVH